MSWKEFGNVLSTPVEERMSIYDRTKDVWLIRKALQIDPALQTDQRRRCQVLERHHELWYVSASL